MRRKLQLRMRTQTWEMGEASQAVAAMAYGTQTCPKVAKIFGPGNQFVTAAKMLLQNSEAMVGIDMPAGPSEVSSLPPRQSE
jgi:histidinol dehydrogenase